jgi:hypothetical protein
VAEIRRICPQPDFRLARNWTHCAVKRLVAVLLLGVCDD